MKREKNDISYILAVFLTINSVEYLSVLTSFRLVIGMYGCLFSFAGNFFIAVGHTTKHMMHDVHCAPF